MLVAASSNSSSNSSRKRKRDVVEEEDNKEVEEEEESDEGFCSKSSFYKKAPYTVNVVKEEDNEEVEEEEESDEGFYSKSLFYKKAPYAVNVVEEEDDKEVEEEEEAEYRCRKAELEPRLRGFRTIDEPVPIAPAAATNDAADGVTLASLVERVSYLTGAIRLLIEIFAEETAFYTDIESDSDSKAKGLVSRIDRREVYNLLEDTTTEIAAIATERE
ncbi:hypothetical protein C8A01DRAFT_42153 [Parachaetomium inaequale]|uniref:Uncharacterized protein n=1 Tax=Parachaetomium inaequale TaxID=2588326 RepID=A0AAN6P610_9PEZI|nr:hypothetical protein C8A01DRAFT_42153 [Parachaetomium inaequale]